MTQNVLKYVLEINDEEQPIGGGEVLLVAEQYGHLVVWTLEDLEVSRVRYVTVVGTGAPVPKSSKHIGSAVMPPFVWHVFETAVVTGD